MKTKLKAKLTIVSLVVVVTLCACGASNGEIEEAEDQETNETAVTQTEETTGSSSSETSQAESVTSEDADNSASTVIPEANKHYAYDVSCADCHGTDNPTEGLSNSEACLTCHDWDSLAEATADDKDLENRMENPHDSHIGEVSCLLCHSNHDESTYYCLTCHPEEEYQDIVVP